MTGHDTYFYVLPSGATIEIENLPGERRGARDVGSSADHGGTVPFENVFAPLGEICQVLFEQVSKSINAPEEISLEMMASLKGRTSFVLVSAEARGTVKVTLTWKQPH